MGSGCFFFKKGAVFGIHIMRKFGICSCLAPPLMGRMELLGKDDALSALPVYCCPSALMSVATVYVRVHSEESCRLLWSRLHRQTALDRRHKLSSSLWTTSEFIFENCTQAQRPHQTWLLEQREVWLIVASSAHLVCSYFADSYMDLKAH